MREIKFKVWDLKTKEFIANGEPMDLYYSARVNAFMFDNDNYDLHKDIVLCQFTNLKDKNKKEIYDGDILGSSGRVIGHIEGGVRGYCYDIVYLNPTDDKRWSLYACIGTDYRGDIEVIGNIYENPDLLTF